jgi:hypothetical protein
MPKNKKNNKFSLSSSSFERKVNNRTEKEVADEKPLMLFSFKDFQYNSVGQTYENWQEEKLLAYMLEKFGHICSVNRIEAEQQKFIKVYGNFPENSAFKNPFPNSELDWAVVMRIQGQKGRVAGYIDGYIFYVVFLDAEHQFFPSEKKNT